MSAARSDRSTDPSTPLRSARLAVSSMARRTIGEPANASSIRRFDDFGVFVSRAAACWATLASIIIRTTIATTTPTPTATPAIMASTNGLLSTSSPQLRHPVLQRALTGRLEHRAIDGDAHGFELLRELRAHTGREQFAAV